MAKLKKTQLMRNDGLVNLNDLSIVDEISLTSIIVDKENNARKKYSNIDELAESINKDTLLQPILVTRKTIKGKHKLVSGFRRYFAIEKLNRPTIKVAYVDGNSEIINLIENIQREDLNPYDLGKALKSFKEKTKKTFSEIAGIFSKSEKWVKDRINVYEIETIRNTPDKNSSSTNFLEKEEAIEKSTTSYFLKQSHYESVRGLTEKEQTEILNKAEKEKLTIKETRELVNKCKAEKKKNKQPVKEESIESILQPIENLIEIYEQASKINRQKISEIAGLLSGHFKTGKTSKNTLMQKIKRIIHK